MTVASGACGEGGPSGPPGGPPVDSVASVDVAPGAPTLVAIGEAIELRATLQNAQGDSLAGKTVLWTSSDTAVAEIDGTGIATAVANGTSTISATVDGVAGSATLTVSQQGTALRIAIRPAGAAAGVAFDIQPVIQIVDRNGHVATNDDTTTVTASIASGEGEIVGGDNATAQAGVATFLDLGIRGRIGARTLRFEADGLAAAVSEAFPLAAGRPQTLDIRVQPDGARAGSPLGAQPVIDILDGNGNVLAHDSTTVVTATIASGGGSITNGGTATAQRGVATFTSLALDGDPGERTLRFEAGSLSAAVSDTFMLAAGSPQSLHIRVQPGGAKAGLPLDPQPVIEIRDGNGNTFVGDSTTVITAIIASGGGSIASSGTATVQDGVATFTSLALNGEPGERTLRFEGQGLTAAVSDTFMLAAGSPQSLHIRVQPGGARAGLPLDPQPVIEIRDGNGNVVADDDTTVITVSIASGGGSITSGETATIEDGVATFAGLAIDGGTGKRTLRFEAEGMAAAVSEAFTLTAGPPEALHIRVEPAGAEAGSPLDPQPVVEIRDASGNLVTDDDTTVVTAIIASGGGSIAGGGTATVHDGVATFTELAIDGKIGERTLRFEAEGLAAAVSEPFTLAAGPPEALHIRIEPGGAESGSPLAPQPVVEVRDASDNVVPGDDATVVTAIIASGGGSIVSGGTATVRNGVATFADLIIDGAAGERTLRFEAEDLTAAVSAPFALTASEPDALHIRVEPAGARAGLPLETQPVVEIRDANGEIVAGDSTTVITATIASGGGSIVSGDSATVRAGVATFTELAIGGSVGERTLRFRAGGLDAAVSKAIALAAGTAASVSLHDGDGQGAPADTDLPVPLRVIVHDDFGNAVSGVAVEWAVTAGTGTIQSDDGPTNDDGVTGSVYRLGLHAGVDTVEASAAGLDGSPVTFTATATPNGRISGTITATSGQMSAGPLAFRNASGRAGARTALAGPAVMPASGPAAGKRMLLLAAGGAAAASDPPAVPLRPQSPPEFVPDELIVTFRAQPLGAPPLGASAYRTPAAAAAVATSVRRALESHERAGGMTVVGVSPALLAARLRVEPGAIASAERALRADPAIERVERNAIVHSLDGPPPANVVHARPPRTEAGARSGPTGSQSEGGSAATADAITPNDPLYVWQAWHHHMIDLPRAWGITTGNPSVVVAVLDDGTRFDHPDIAPNLTTDGYDFVSDGSILMCAGDATSRAGDGDDYDPNPETPVKRPWDDGCAGNVENNGGHGLHVAGIIGAAGNNGGGVASVSWHVSIRPVRVLDIAGRGTHYDIAQGLLYAAGLPADDGAGGSVMAPAGAPIINMSLAGPATSMVLEEAVAAATNAGSLIIAAAGNAGSAAPNYPAAYPQAVSVSAVQPDGSLASYSSFGATIDIAAPGGETAKGCDFGVWSTTWNFVQNTRHFSCWAGTSMATPHVAGVAALVLATQPGLTHAQLRARLIDYATPAGDPSRFGAGIVNARNSLTQSRAPAQTLYARLIDNDGGGTIATVMAANGSYEFTELDDGNYYVYAGEDEDGDGVIGVPVRRWGAAGGSAAPTAVAVDGAGNYPASFSIGIPLASDPPNPQLGANVLPIGGYLTGESATQTVHEFLVQVPTAGSYVFETSAVSGTCGFALEADTRLTLSDESGAVIASDDDIDAPAGNYCSRITAPMLQPGKYQLRVMDVLGRYAVSARKQP